MHAASHAHKMMSHGGTDTCERVEGPIGVTHLIEHAHYLAMASNPSDQAVSILAPISAKAPPALTRS